jgi:serine/threonine-protein kinase
MTKPTFTCGSLLLTGALLLSAPVWADTSPGDTAAAAVVFADAKKLLKEGRFNDACPKFEESQRLDPTPGTLLNLGDCYKQTSPPRTASAWGAYQQAEIMARKRGDKARQEAAAERAQTIEPVLSRVTIAVVPAARLPGLEVKWDGKLIGAGLWGTAIPVDSGEHRIEASAPGKTSWEGKVLVRLNGGTMTAEVPALVEAPAQTAASPGDRELQPFWNTQRYIGGGIGAAGLVGVVIGSVFGIKAANKNADSLPHCMPNNSKRCDAAGVALGADALSAAKVSTLGFMIGGAALIGGSIVLLTAPSGAPKNKIGLRRIEAQPLVGLGAGGMTLRGEW